MTSFTLKSPVSADLNLSTNKFTLFEKRFAKRPDTITTMQIRTNKTGKNMFII